MLYFLITMDVTMNDESINLRQHLLNQLIEANESMMIDYYRYGIFT